MDRNGRQALAPGQVAGGALGDADGFGATGEVGPGVGRPEGSWPDGRGDGCSNPSGKGGVP
jgi:hypothetical protein